MTDRPVVIDLDEDAALLSPADAPPVVSPGEAPTGQAMQALAQAAARPPSPITRWFWQSLLAVILFIAGVAAYDFLTSLIARSPVLAAAALVIFGAFLILCLVIVIGELGALARLKRMDRFQREAGEVRASGELTRARAFATELTRFYKGRADIDWGAARLTETVAESFDADTVLMAVEDRLLAPLDAQAMREVEAAARQVATVTALVPIAFADIIAALTANLRMIRQIAQVYGGRSGTVGGLRLTRAVITHLVATGALAVGDDLLGSVGGGHVLAKISRRFGEGLVNGALTARVGVAAMEVCRPLPFSTGKRPSVSAVVGRALTGLFEKENRS